MQHSDIQLPLFYIDICLCLWIKRGRSQALVRWARLIGKSIELSILSCRRQRARSGRSILKLWMLFLMTRCTLRRSGGCAATRIPSLQRLKQVEKRFHRISEILVSSKRHCSNISTCSSVTSVSREEKWDTILLANFLPHFIRSLQWQEEMHDSDF